MAGDVFEWMANPADDKTRLIRDTDRPTSAPSRLDERTTVSPSLANVLNDPEFIDDYKIIEPIGEGGMGRVFRAMSPKPVQREVALKLIKLGLETKAVVARFDAERQALAIMDHPNIARVIDAGSSSDGRHSLAPTFASNTENGETVDMDRSLIFNVAGEHDC